MHAAGGLWLLSLGMGLIFLASVAAALLREVSWHELKEYCKRRQRRELFDAMHEQFDEVTISAELWRAVGIVLAVAGAAAWGLATGGIRLPAAGGLGALGGLIVAGSLLFLTLAVWIPSAVAEIWGPPVLFRMWPAMAVARRLASPLNWGAIWLSSALHRMGGAADGVTEEEAFEDEILAMVTEGMHDGHLEVDAGEMIEGVIELGDADAADIMTPRSKMDALSVDLGWDEVLRFVTSCGRTRIPVYRDTLDRIVGILYVKDLLAQLAQHAGRPQASLEQLAREPWYVPPTQKLDDLLQEFRKTRNHLAIVRDEFSRVAGLVTIEDVLEEIVGEIVDETDKEFPDEIRPLDERTAIVHGRAHLAEINARLGLQLPEPEEFDTIAGYVMHHLRRVPEVGEQIEIDAIRFTVLQGSRRKVEKLRLEMIEPSPSN